MAKKKNPEVQTGDGSAAGQTGRCGSEPPDFESSLAQLEKVVADLESGQLSLTDSIKRYELGVGLLRQCHSALQTVQQKIGLLTQINEQGEATTQPLDALAVSESGEGSAATAKTGRRKRSERPDPDPDLDAGSRLF